MKRLLALSVTGFALAVGCAVPFGQKAPPYGSTTFVGGDSLTVQAIGAGSVPPSWHMAAWFGWQAENVKPVLDGDTRDTTKSPAVVVIALGQNDAVGDGGFSSTDADQLAALAQAPHPAACVAWLLPYYPGPDATRATGIANYRRFVTRYAAYHHQPVTDWATWWRPEHVGTDGFHLTNTGTAAYGLALTAAVKSCEGAS